MVEVLHAAARPAVDDIEGALRLAEDLPRPAQRFVAAHVAALRIAAEVLARRPGRRVLRTPTGVARGVWVVLAEAAPELGEWASYFAALQPRRLAVMTMLEQGERAGATALVGEREADDLVRAARLFRRAAHV